jgi:hypothetical protein
MSPNRWPMFHPAPVMPLTHPRSDASLLAPTLRPSGVISYSVTSSNTMLTKTSKPLRCGEEYSQHIAAHRQQFGLTVTSWRRVGPHR